MAPSVLPVSLVDPEGTVGWPNVIWGSVTHSGSHERTVVVGVAATEFARDDAMKWNGELKRNARWFEDLGR